TSPAASTTCQRAPAASCASLAMKVDIPFTAHSRASSPRGHPDYARVRNFPRSELAGAGACHLGPAVSDNGKPKSYERFWALSSSGTLPPINQREARVACRLAFPSARDESVIARQQPLPTAFAVIACCPRFSGDRRAVAVGIRF